MTENTSIKEDFGIVKVETKTTLGQQIKEFMEPKGFNVAGCDVCSMRVEERTDEKDVVLFKFVHWTVPTAETEPFYKIEFKYK